MIEPRDATAPPHASDAATTYHASRFDLWTLGMTMAIGGHYISWHAGLAAGVESNGLSIFMTGAAYFCSTLALTEIVSGWPFAGGAYGLSRCSLGYFGGFLVGSCEALHAILYASSVVSVLATMILKLLPVSSQSSVNIIKPCIWVATYAAAMAMHYQGGKFFWRCNAVLGLVSFGILLVYLFGSLPLMSYQTFSGGPAWRVRGDGEMFLQQLPMSAWLFVGNESINSVANVVVQPKKVLPGCQIASMLTLFATSIGVFFVAISMPPGVDKLQDELVVIRGGITTMFRTSDAVATILSIPATFATIFGFMFSYSSILSAMAASKLMPLQLAYLHPEHQTHPVAACAGSAVGLICCFLADAFPAAFNLFNTSMIFGFAVNLAQCWNHRFMCVNFKHLARCYCSEHDRSSDDTLSPRRSGASNVIARRRESHALCPHYKAYASEYGGILDACVGNSSKHRLHSRRPSASLMGALIAAAQVVPSGELRPRRPSAPDIGAAAATLNRTLSAGSLSLLIDATLKRGSLHQQASMTNIKVRRFSGSTRVVPSPERIANEIPVLIKRHRSYDRFGNIPLNVVLVIIPRSQPSSEHCDSTLYHELFLQIARGLR
ncbi:hypothetical protein LEN26_020593 [Aphanomyces euteiches]|nr:hypothetical protein LEN26_020593 [Aphanomyces euteiches]